MIMIVLGAGASYDSSPDYPMGTVKAAESRMPLANELFSNRQLFSDVLKLYQQCYPILTHIRLYEGVSVPLCTRNPRR